MTRPDIPAILDRGRRDPVWFARHVLVADPTDYQCRILRSIAVNRHTRVRSSHGIGKTALAGMAISWFAPTRPQSITISTAPTERQVKDQLWGEVGKLYGQARIPIAPRAPKTKAWALGKKWFAMGFTAPPHEPTKFQGFHAPHVLIVADEACGISKKIYDEGISACMSNEDAHLLSIGNPTDANTEFARSFLDTSPGAFKISAFDTPNFTHFGITLDHIRSGEWVDLIAGRPLPRPYLVTPDWVADRWRKWGEESPLWMGRVMAEFPAAGDDALVPLPWVTAAEERFRSADWASYRTSVVQLGVDVARFGSDSTIIYERRDGLCRKLAEYHGADTMVVCGHIIRAQQETGASRVYIDEIGVGAGVVDRLKEQGYSWVIGVNFGAKAQDDEKYANQRAECYWLMREAVERGELAISNDDFAGQVTAIRWKPNSKGQITIEAKEELKRRIGRSPDDADAVALTYSTEHSVVVV